MLSGGKARNCLDTEGLPIATFPEAARMRVNGELISLAEHICCPVIAIHGDYDPHPAEGVQVPLSSRLTDFHFHLLPCCGHSPWMEQYAMETFYEIIVNELRSPQLK